jgi:tRNA-specific 2-thiouridylase
LGIGGVASGNDEPWFVAEKDPQRNILTVVQGRDHPLLWSDEMTTESPHWINGAPNALTTGKVWHCTVKTRYRQQDVPARVMSTAQGLHVAFDTPQWAVTPGQYAVFYDGDVCSGGAVIESAIHVATAVADTGTAPL